MRASNWIRWPGSQVGRMAGREMRVPPSLMRTVLSTHASLVNSSAGRRPPASGRRGAKLSPGGGGVDGDVDGEADLAIDGHDAGAGNGGAVDGEGHGERHGFAGREAAQPGGGGLELDAGSGALQLQQRGGGAGRAFVPELEAHLDGLAGGRPRRANNLEARKRDTIGYSGGSPGGRADAD